MQIARKIAQQSLWAAPLLANRPGNAQWQWVAVTPPKIGASLTAQRQFVLHQRLFKQNARLECVVSKHSLTKTVDSVDRRFVHLALGSQQLRGGLWQIANLRHQRGKQRV
ncbi:hypothetical protein D3C77_682190 [compost metagenome]